MPTTADVYKLVFAYTAGGEFMECVQHYLSSVTSSTNPQADALSLCSAMTASVQTALLGCWHSDVTLLGYRAARVNNGGGPSAVSLAPAGTVGTYGGSGGMPTSRQAAMIEMDYHDTLAVKPRWRQGRFYMGGVPGPFWSGDLWTSDAVTAYQALMSALSSTIGSAPTFTFGIWSRKNSTIWTAGGLELSGMMGHQKRRTKPTL